MTHCCHDPIIVMITLLSLSQCLSYRGSTGEVSWLEIEPIHVYGCVIPPQKGLPHDAKFGRNMCNIMELYEQ
jgi:hypothetical protein